MSKTNGDHKDENLVIKTILDGIKMFENAYQNLLSISKKFLLSRVNSEYNDLAKFAEDRDSHLFEGGIRRLLKKGQRKAF